MEKTWQNSTHIHNKNYKQVKNEEELPHNWKKKNEANTVLNGEKLDISHLRFDAKKGYLSTPLLNILLEGRWEKIKGLHKFGGI